jgi:hypothetical protein
MKCLEKIVEVYMSVEEFSKLSEHLNAMTSQFKIKYAHLCFENKPPLI